MPFPFIPIAASGVTLTHSAYVTGRSILASRYGLSIAKRALNHFKDNPLSYLPLSSGLTLLYNNDETVNNLFSNFIDTVTRSISSSDSVDNDYILSDDQRDAIRILSPIVIKYFSNVDVVRLFSSVNPLVEDNLINRSGLNYQIEEFIKLINSTDIKIPEHLQFWKQAETPRFLRTINGRLSLTNPRIDHHGKPLTNETLFSLELASLIEHGVHVEDYSEKRYNSNYDDNGALITVPFINANGDLQIVDTRSFRSEDKSADDNEFLFIYNGELVTSNALLCMLNAEIISVNSGLAAIGRDDYKCKGVAILPLELKFLTAMRDRLLIHKLSPSSKTSFKTIKEITGNPSNDRKKEFKVITALRGAHMNFIELTKQCLEEYMLLEHVCHEFAVSDLHFDDGISDVEHILLTTTLS